MASTHSTDGREWARLSKLKPGDKVEIDDGFTCNAAGIYIVAGDARGLYIPCSEGGHHLDGQADDGEHCVGIWPAGAP